MFKNNKGAIIRQDYFDISKLRGSARRSAILMVLDQMNFRRGGYQYQIQSKLDGACGVKYRRSTPKPFKFS